MANPRQRRKLRSGSHKPVRQSRKAKKILKKPPPIRGPKVLQEAWDAHKTVRQNYEALGLVASLNPTASGGAERPLVASTNSERLMDIDNFPEASGSSSAGPSTLRKGFGRIIRDADGNVVDVELAEEDTEEELVEPAARLVEEIPDQSQASNAVGWVALGFSTATGGSASIASGSHVVHSLEEMVETKGGAVARFSSTAEGRELQRLVARYGQDVTAMARDRKLNPMQRTAGQLSRAIKRAGGFAALLDSR